MSKIEEQNIKYLGFSKPESPEEIEVEIIGLESAKSQIELRSSQLRQSLAIVRLKLIEQHREEMRKQEEIKKEEQTKEKEKGE